MKNRPIGVFDSGVGGLTVLKEINKVLPWEKIIYYGDTYNAPYGEKSPSQILTFVRDIMDFLMSFDVKAIVMACNTSSAIALPQLSHCYPVPLLGTIEAGAWEAYRQTYNDRIGVIANLATVNSQAYPEMVKSFGNHKKVYAVPCPKLVPLIERGDLDSDLVWEALYEYLTPLKNDEIDTLIMGCTHYPFLADKIQHILGPHVNLVNPAVKVAEKLRYFLLEEDLLNDSLYPSEHEFYVSCSPETFRFAGSNFIDSSVLKKVSYQPLGQPCLV